MTPGMSRMALRTRRLWSLRSWSDFSTIGRAEASLPLRSRA